MCVQIRSVKVCKEFSCNVAICCCRSLLVQVSLHCALFHCVDALPVICPVWSYVMSPALLLSPVILLMYQVLLHKMQTSHTAWNQLWQPGVTSCLAGLDWQLFVSLTVAMVCVCVFVDFCDASVQILSKYYKHELPLSYLFFKDGKD